VRVQVSQASPNRPRYDAVDSPPSVQTTAAEGRPNPGACASGRQPSTASASRAMAAALRGVTGGANSHAAASASSRV
jgi:hypothetical protein